MRVIAISDTHTFGSKVTIPDGDMVIHAGDHTFRGTKSEMKAALKWFNSLPHKYKIFIAGNHDFFMDERFKDGHNFRSWTIRRPYSKQHLIETYAPDCIYLQDSGCEIEGYKIYGSPWQPWYYDWAFNFPADTNGMDYKYPMPKHDREQAKETWAKIPDDVQILVTHTPPLSILDRADDESKLGCPELVERLGYLSNLRLHVFGHIHEGYGRLDYESEDLVYVDNTLSNQKRTFVNAAICNIHYDPDNLNLPIVIDV